MEEISEEDWFRLALELIEAIREDTTLAELEVTHGNRRLRIRGASASGVSGPSPSVGAIVAAPAEPAVTGTERDNSARSGSPARDPERAKFQGTIAIPVPEDTDLEIVRSPMVGVFYRAPEPGAAPYADLGTVVSGESVVGLIEAMKVFTPVTAMCEGTVEAVYVGDGAFVEFDQPICGVRAGERQKS